MELSWTDGAAAVAVAAGPELVGQGKEVLVTVMKYGMV
jgi:hypothetical protein